MMYGAFDEMHGGGMVAIPSRPIWPAILAGPIANPPARGEPSFEDILAMRSAPSDELDDAQFEARMLYVEDNERIAEVTGMMLEDLGFDLSVAASGEEAWRLIEAESDAFDIIFTDVVMPGMSGVGLAKKAQAMFPAMPIVLTSGFSDEIVAGYGSGFELLQKPYTRSALIACLRRHLDGRGAA